MGVDSRFVEDRTYVSFLFQIKEALDIKNSRVTFFRKSLRNTSKYTKDSLLNIDKKTLERTDVGFKAFKSIRGTAPYFEDMRKKVFAMIRQLKAPDIFFYQIGL